MEISEIAKEAAADYQENIINMTTNFQRDESGRLLPYNLAYRIQQAIDESTANKDAEIEGLREELALSKKDSLRITALEEWGAYKFENGLGHTREVEDPWVIRKLLDAIGSEVGVIEEVDKEESDGDQ